MKDIHPKIKIAILRILREANHPIGSSIITNKLKSYGYDLSSRSVRLYLHQLEENELVSHASRGREGGRKITPKGIVEIREAQVFDRVGFTSVKIDSLACQTTLHLAMRTGSIVLNVSTIEEDALPQAIDEMMTVFESGLCMGEYVTICRGEKSLGHFQVPQGKVAIGTVCSVTFNGILLKQGIPVSSRFGGVLELHHFQCTRFTEVIDYSGTSLDPMEVFIKGQLTHVREAARSGEGYIGASFREIPSPILSQVESIHRKLKAMGLGGILLIGTPNQPLLDFPVQEGRTGIIVAGGLNPVAAVEESGIPTKSHALCTLYSFEKLYSYRELPKRLKKNKF